MKISIPRQDLLDTVNKVKTVVAAKSALPILSHILIETGENEIRLAATDLKVSKQVYSASLAVRQTKFYSTLKMTYGMKSA